MSKTTASDEDIVNMLKSRIRYGYGQKQLARELNVTPAFISAVFTGRSAPSKAMAKMCGFERNPYKWIKK